MSHEGPYSHDAQEPETAGHQPTPRTMAYMVQDRRRQRQASDYGTDPVGRVAEHTHEHVGDSIGVIRPHPIASGEVVDSLDTQEKERGDDRGQRTYSLAEVEDRLEH